MDRVSKLNLSLLNDSTTPVNSKSMNQLPALGSAYAGIVRKCLACDFGQGDNLNDQGLQSAFRDVVCELERLEVAFSKLQIGITAIATS
jgi:hypothetical protein